VFEIYLEESTHKLTKVPTSKSKSFVILAELRRIVYRLSGAHLCDKELKQHI